MSSKSKLKGWGAALGAGILASVVNLPAARGELVYETAPPAVSPATDNRENLRQALGASEKAQVTVQQLQQAPSQVQAAAPPVALAPTYAAPQVAQSVQLQAPAAAAAAPSAAPTGDDLQNLSKTDLMRRERLRDELKNEDILEERLEELRLRDEQRRTQQLLGADTVSDALKTSAANAVAPTAAPAPLANSVKEEVVVAPVTTNPGSGAALAASAPVASVQADLSRDSDSSLMDKIQFSVQPRGGVANMTGSSMYLIQPRYSAGVGLGAEFTDNIGLELGYTYGSYGVSMSSANPTIQYAQAQLSAYGINSSLQTIEMHQNVFDAGLKLHVLGKDSRFRPFISGGGGYSRSFINYSSAVLAAANQTAGMIGYGNQALGTDYNLSQFLGYLSAGFDIKLTKNISINAMFRYYAVLSSQQDQAVNNLALMGYSPMSVYGVPSAYSSYNALASNVDKSAVGGSVSNSGFYTIMGGLSLSF